MQTRTHRSVGGAVKGWWLILLGALLLAASADGIAGDTKTKLSCVLSVASTDLAEESANRFSDDLVVEVTDDGKSLSIYGTGVNLDFLFIDLGIGPDPANYYRSHSSKDVWSVDTRTRDMTRESANIIIFEKVNINRFTGTLTYSRDEIQSEAVSLKKISATGKCEKMEGKSPKF